MRGSPYSSLAAVEAAPLTTVLVRLHLAHHGHLLKCSGIQATFPERCVLRRIQLKLERARGNMWRTD